jgi:hypothetical protein
MAILKAGRHITPCMGLFLCHPPGSVLKNEMGE